MIEEKLKEVPKVWGREIWLVNNEKYCSKLLYVNKGASGSYHYHKNKQETFYGIAGIVWLTVEDEHFLLHPFASPITVMPYEKHSIAGLLKENSIILEVSTPHSDEDVVRIEESKSGMD